MMKIKELLAKNNYLLGKIFGGCSVVAILLIIIAMVFMKGDENRVEKITSNTQVANQTIAESSQEQTTLKNGEAEETTVNVGSQLTEELIESSGEETTLAEEVESSEEEVTTKTVADSGKETSSKNETTVKKEDNTTKKNETTVAKQTTKQTSKETTTVKKQSTTQQETTTEEQTTEKTGPKSGRIKECELAIVDMCKTFRPDLVNEGSIYKYVEGKVNAFIYQRDVFGWDNMAIHFRQYIKGDPEYYNGDDFVVMYPDDVDKQIIIRDMHIKRKYNQAIIDDCEKWVEGNLEYSASDFEKYLEDRYTWKSSASILNATRDDKWIKTWCYWDTQHQVYRTEIEGYYGFSVVSYEEDGYYTDVNEIYEKLDNENKGYVDTVSIYCRWVYDADADRTTIYAIAMSN